MKNIFFLFFFISLSRGIWSQINTDGIPYSFSDKLPSVAKFVKMPDFDPGLLIKEDNEQQLKGNKSFRFAKEFNIDLTPDNAGEWTNTDGGQAWRIGIQSHNAHSLYLTFGLFRLEPGVKLFVYTPGYAEFRGAFTKKNNNNFNILSIAPLPGDELIVELDIPKGTSEFGILHVTKVFHDYRNAFGKKITNNLKDSYDEDSCFVNINCPAGAYWQTEKKAICKLIAGSELCTGTLIANTLGDKTPYFLTAYHCISDTGVAAGAMVVFNFEQPYCGATVDTQVQILSGASLIATTDHKLDFTLLKLNEIPPLSYKPYYAGWDISTFPPQGVACIHHPLDLGKKISIANNSLVTEDFGQNFDSLSTWKVSHWDVGTTSRGSSGSPIFNPQHRIVGTLTGGEADCGNPVNDYFTKFYLSWQYYPDKNNQLKAWLDPENSGLSKMDGYDPYGFNMEFCDTTWNIFNGEKLELSSLGLNWGWISGHNSSSFSQFAEKFYSPVPLKIFGISLNVAKAYYSQQLSNISVKIWEGTSLPSKEIYSKIVFLKNIQPNAVNFISFDSVINVPGDFFIGYSINYSLPGDSFAVYHAANRNRGPSTMYVFNGDWHSIDDLTSPAMFTSLGIKAIECYGKSHVPEVINAIAYPNPCKNYVNIRISDGITVNGVVCFDMIGKVVPITYQCSDGNILVNFNLPSGIYFIKVMTKAGILILRIMEIHN